MNSSRNKELVSQTFDELAKGNGRPFVALMDEAVSWRIIGSTPWSKTYQGKAAVLNDLLAPLGRQLEGPNVIVASRLIAEGDLVVVEASGRNTTRAGELYRNSYCWIFRFAGEQVAEIVEYADTALFLAVLRPPDQSEAGDAR